MTIAVTGLNNVDSPAPGVPVIRALKESKAFEGRVIGLLYDTMEPGAYLPDIADASYVIPYPSAGLEQFLSRLSAIHEKEHIDVLIPTLDSELFSFAKLAPRLKELGIKTYLPSVDQLNLRSKDKLADFSAKHDIKVPKNILATSVHDLHRIQSEFEYPVVIKGIFYDAVIVNNLDEAGSAFRKLSAKWGLPIIVQEFVTGDEYNVCALGDGERMVGAVAMKKMYITDKGKAWSGITIRDSILMDLSRKVMTALQWKSGIELEFVKQKETNEYYLLEINPRFPAWVYLSVAAGQNLPYALMRLALGEKIPPFEQYEVGKIFLRYSWDWITDIKEFEKIVVQGEIHHE